MVWLTSLINLLPNHDFIYHTLDFHMYIGSLSFATIPNIGTFHVTIIKHCKLILLYISLDFEYQKVVKFRVQVADLPIRFSFKTQILWLAAIIVTYFSWSNNLIFSILNKKSAIYLRWKNHNSLHGVLWKMKSVLTSPVQGLVLKTKVGLC